MDKHITMKKNDGTIPRTMELLFTKEKNLVDNHKKRH